MRSAHRYIRISLAAVLLLAGWYFLVRDNSPRIAPAIPTQPAIAESENAPPAKVERLWQASADSALESPPEADHDLASLRTALRRDDSAHTVKTKTDGSKAVSLGGSYQTVAAAQRTEDGQLIIQCFERYQPVENFLLNPPQATPPASNRPLATQ